MIWTTEKFLKILSPLSYSYETQETSLLGKLCINSQDVQKGDIFISLKGEKNDGHSFISDAFERGAALAVVCTPAEGNYIQVEDTQKALEMLGVFCRNQSPAQRIAITGSVGKTTTKELSQQIFERMAPTISSPASYNNHLGVPLSLTLLTPQIQYGIFEVGMNHPGEIAPLTSLIQPHVALITTIGAAHIGNLHSLEKIALEKSTIFQKGLQTALVPNDLPQTPLLLEAAQQAFQVLKVGKNSESDIFTLSKEEDFLREKTSLTISLKGKKVNYTVPFLGHYADLTVWIWAILESLGQAHKDLIPFFQDLKIPEGRGKNHQISLGAKKITLIDDAYNANPVSMKAGLDLLSKLPVRGRRIAVLGDMLELGKRSAEFHRELGEALATSNIHAVFSAGPCMKDMHEALNPSQKILHSLTVNGLFGPIEEFIKDGDVIWVKGSKGSQISRVVRYIVEKSEA